MRGLGLHVSYLRSPAVFDPLFLPPPPPPSSPSFLLWFSFNPQDDVELRMISDLDLWVWTKQTNKNQSKATRVLRLPHSCGTVLISPLPPPLPLHPHDRLVRFMACACSERPGKEVTCPVPSLPALPASLTLELEWHPSKPQGFSCLPAIALEGPGTGLQILSRFLGKCWDPHSGLHACPVSGLSHWAISPTTASTLFEKSACWFWTTWLYN